jgi:cell division protein ZapA (FtsZ GTPase activity inhibitor)
MENTVPVNLKIDGRKYPIKALKDEEENLRKAEKLINERINFHLKDKKIYDKQDLYAMVMIEYVYNHIKLEEGNENLLKSIGDKLSSVEDVLNRIN